MLTLICPVMAISIHALLAESDIVHAVKLADTMLFLSTLSLRRATSEVSERVPLAEYFYPRSPCGERRIKFQLDFINQKFLSTLSLRRATRPRQIIIVVIDDFYPRSPCGERLNIRQIQKIENGISIHALLAESDNGATHYSYIRKYFYPRSPCGERHTSKDVIKTANNFYPRSPCGERRNAHLEIRQPCAISIHALLAESDP